jgi:hypothetical protein
MRSGPRAINEPVAPFLRKKGAWREAKFPFSIGMVRHTSRKWALLGGKYFFTLIPNQNRILAPKGIRTASAKVIRPNSSVECRLIRGEWYNNAQLSPDLLIQ